MTKFSVLAATALFGAAPFQPTGQAAPTPLPSTNTLLLATRTHVWTRGIETNLQVELRRKSQDPVAALVKFKEPLRPADFRAFSKADLRLEEFLSDTSYLVLIPPSFRRDNLKLPKQVFAAALYKPDDKLRIRFGDKYPEWAYDPAKDQLKLLVGFWNGIGAEVITRDLALVKLSGRRYGADNSWLVVAPPRALLALAALPSVKIVEPGPVDPVPLNDGGRRVTLTDPAQSADFTVSPPRYNQVSGDGIHIAICEDGVMEGHKDFQRVDSAGQAVQLRFYYQRTNSSEHGTQAASIAAGNGFSSAEFDRAPFLLRGHAPEALLGDYPYFHGEADLYFNAIYDDGTQVSNHSYLQSLTSYDGVARSLDAIVRGTGTNSYENVIPARPAVWGAGNNGFEAQPRGGEEEGYYSVFTSAKNTISVGSVDTRRTRHSRFSALGPTSDGRIKPDVVAPGCLNSISGEGIMAASIRDDHLYFAGAGTSYAAPVVSGIIALMMQQYKKTFLVEPLLLPATYKAMLVQSATDMVKTNFIQDAEWQNPDTLTNVFYHEGPDFATGYGLVNAEAARVLISEASRWKEGGIRDTNHIQTWCIDVPAKASELKVVIAWDDEPGCTATTQTVVKLVNDLDLALKAPDGLTHLPWTLDPPRENPDLEAPARIEPAEIRPAYRAADHRNNVEMVTVTNPMAGVWQGTVKATQLTLGNVQAYGIASSHTIGSWCLPPEPDSPRPKSVCARYPDLCRSGLHRLPNLEGKDGGIQFVPSGPVPVEEICKFMLNCPGCDGPGWSLCPGYRMNVSGLPKHAQIVVFTDQDRIFSETNAGAEVRQVNVVKLRPGERQYVLITDAHRQPLNQRLNLKFEFQDLPPSAKQTRPRPAERRGANL